MDELEQAVGLGVFWAVLGNAAQNGLSVVLKNGKLNEVGAVEHYVRGFLEGVDPLALGCQNVGPVGDGFPCRKGAFVVVADNTAKEAVI